MFCFKSKVTLGEWRVQSVGWYKTEGMISVGFTTQGNFRIIYVECASLSACIRRDKYPTHSEVLGTIHVSLDRT